jgi:pyruvate formate lyase activating enzyme
VPTHNDSERELREMCKWILAELGPDVPVHFTRFHPDYRMMDLPPTPVATLERAWAIAREEGLRYAFVGNVPGHPGNNTTCPGCGEVVIGRKGFFITEQNLRGGRCGHCDTPIAGVWA